MKKLNTVLATVGNETKKCYIRDNDVYSFWVNKDKTDAGLNVIIQKILTGNKTLSEVHKYFTKKYDENHMHHAYDCTSADTLAEREFCIMLRGAIQLGHGKDYNFERAFR